MMNFAKTPEQGLFLAVIERAILDAHWSGDRWTAAGNPRPEYMEQKRADSWLRSGSRDFYDVCAMAGIDGDFLRDAYRAGRINADLFRGGEESRKRRRAS